MITIVLIYSIQNGKYFLYQSYHKGREGWWIDTEPPSYDKDAHGTEKKILGNVDAAIAPDGAVFTLHFTRRRVDKGFITRWKRRGFTI